MAWGWLRYLVGGGRSVRLIVQGLGLFTLSHHKCAFLLHCVRCTLCKVTLSSIVHLCCWLCGTKPHLKMTSLPIQSHSEEEVRKAYRKAALKYHPDKALSACRFRMELTSSGAAGRCCGFRGTLILFRQLCLQTWAQQGGS